MTIFNPTEGEPHLIQPQKVVCIRLLEHIMHASHEDHVFLCKCTAEIIVAGGVDPAAARAFVHDFSALFLRLRRLSHPAEQAARTGAVLGWSAVMAGREADFRSHRSCRMIDTIGRRMAAAVQADRAAPPRLSRLALAALRRDQKPPQMPHEPIKEGHPMSKDILSEYDDLVRDKEALRRSIAEGASIDAFLFITDRLADEVENLRRRLRSIAAAAQSWIIGFMADFSPLAADIPIMV